MFKKIYKTYKSLHDKQIDARGLAIFRIFFSLVLLGEIIQLFYFRHLVFDKIPYIVPSEFAMWPLFLFWTLAILFIIFGLFTRIAAIVNYILTVGVLGTISSFEYHMFYTYLTIGFLFILLPISKTFSLDRLLLKLKYSNTKFTYRPPETVSVLSYFIIILLGIGFVYFDSVFFKFTSHLWLNGLGMWLPASLPQAIFINTEPILNLEYFVIGLGYLTLVFETLFLFTFWRKKWRVPMLIIGIGLHIGILICFPIPFFALGAIMIYLLMVPVRFWEIIFAAKKKSVSALKFYYDAECPLCNRTKIIIKHFDAKNKIEFLTVQGNSESQPAFKEIANDALLDNIHSVDNKGRVYAGLETYIKVFGNIWYLKPLSWFLRFPGIHSLASRVYKYVAVNRTTERCTEENCGYTPPVLPTNDENFKILQNFTLNDIKVRTGFFLLLIACLMQLNVSYTSALTMKAKDAIGLSEFRAVKLSNKVSSGIASLITKVFFGITHHALFMDSHFNGYNHTIAVVYITKSGKEVWLPIFDKDGTPGDYLFGPNWAKWTFRVNNPQITHVDLISGIRDFTAFWAYKNNISLEDAVFEIRVKKNKGPKHWEEDFLNKQLQHPWLEGGMVRWKKGEFYPQVKIIENM